jgi:octaprenyl-diphosphate synthase
MVIPTPVRTSLPGPLETWVRHELSDVEAALATVPRGTKAVQRAAHHLLDLRGKQLRPMCVALASKVGSGFDERARELAVAVELVHTATLLHDDVVDVAEQRRGRAAARVIYGNAASIFAGDWLLVEALRRITAVDPAMVAPMLGVIEEMILAESIQLERRGRVGAMDRASWLEVVEGKTASLFRWAMAAGARAGGLDGSVSSALQRFGVLLGIAFQTVDDCLDLAGDPAVTGKDALADLREGKLTFPVLVAVEREPAFAERLASILAAAEEHGEIASEDAAAVTAALVRTDGIGAAKRFAADHIRRAIAVLDEVPAGPGRDALANVAEASIARAA